ncbi:MAG: ComEC/Rec2 family competence protein [Candidatus Liptonbacteria bacterium]|nr:ComEC/Rec2 family competence protein [Candidatus Liptonbacteria bacterium]
MIKHLSLADAVFWAASAFLIGVLAASLEWNIFFILGIAGICAAGFALFSQNTRRAIALCTIFAPVLIFGAFYFHFYFNIKSARGNIVFGKMLPFSGIINDEPKVYEKYQSLGVALKPPLQGTVRILISPLENFHYGDEVEGEGIIELPRSIADMPTAVFPKIRVIAAHKGFWLKESLLNFKHGLLAQFQKNLPAGEAALLGGITFGSKSGFTKEFNGQMALSGTTHLVALSGYNISILVLAVAQVAGSFLSRRKTFYLTTAVIFLFVTMVGLGASVVRAAIMGFLTLLAKEAGRIYNMRNAIVLTAAGMVAVNPAVLVFDAGFQLSFASLLGIVYLPPVIKRFLRAKEENMAGLAETAIMTISAQFAVIPIIIQTFGRFSLTAIVANVLILEFIPFTMFLGFLLAAVGPINFYLGFLVAKLVEVLLTYEIGVIKLFAVLTVPMAAPFNNPLVPAFIYYAALSAFVYYFSPARTVSGAK